MDRKHISWKTKCAAAVLELAYIRHLLSAVIWVPYEHAKNMTEDQFLSLFQWDHNILHETGHPDADKYWNLTPLYIQAHRIKTKADAKVIAKGRRIRKKMTPEAHALLEAGFNAMFPAKRKLQSRGFDKTKRRKMDGTVVPK
jgi:hypothetical protein